MEKFDFGGKMTSMHSARGTTHHEKRRRRRRFAVSGVEGDASLRSTATEEMSGHSCAAATPCYGGGVGDVGMLSRAVTTRTLSSHGGVLTTSLYRHQPRTLITPS
eukprot:2905590-Pleurochrysis_carterae.AAC.2